MAPARECARAMGSRIADMFGRSSGPADFAAVRPGAPGRVPPPAAPAPSDAVLPALLDGVNLGLPIGLPDGLDPAAGVRQSQALNFLARSESLSLRIDAGGLSLDLTAVSQQLAIQFAGAPAGPVGLDAMEEFLEQAEALSGADVKLLKEFLLLLRTFLQDDGPAAEFLLQVQDAFANFTGRGLDAANAFLAQVGETRGVRVSVQAAQLFVNISVTVGEQHLSFTVSITETNVSITADGVQEGDPLVLDLDGDGIELTGVDDGAQFDLDADGSMDQTAFVSGDDGLLALDRNGNGVIDDGGELFGDQHGAVNGFDELARFDDNADGRIDAADAVFSSLRVLYDVDGDGLIALHELGTLAALNIASIDLAVQDTDEAAAGGNRLTQQGTFTRTDGSQGLAADAMLRFRQTS